MRWIVPEAFVAADTACKLSINADSYAFLRVSKELLEGEGVSNRSHDGACCPSVAIRSGGPATGLNAENTGAVRLHVLDWV